MTLKNLNQSSLNTTFMGVARGVLDYYGIAMSDSTLFGASGHGFAINIHDELCPSGPYCWNREPIQAMLRNIGIEMDSLGYFGKSSTADERMHVEGLLKIHLDSGHPCALLNLEYQLITGYGETSFHAAQPWPPNDFPPKTLTFTTWPELGDGIHMEFVTFTPVRPEPPKKILEDSLKYAVNAWRDPSAHTYKPYGFGPDAYDNWCAAIAAGFGSTHGNWWNGTVWSECRNHLRGYFSENSEVLGADDLALILSGLYGSIGGLLAEAADRNLAPELQIEKLNHAKTLDDEAVRRIEDYLANR